MGPCNELTFWSLALSQQQHDLSGAFHPSFTGGRQEMKWILRSLGDFYVDEWFTDVLFRVKGGKEATVYCCKAHPATGHQYLAAKVYRPRMFRAMKNDSLYKTGRLIRSGEGNYPDARTARALKKRSRYGRALDAGAWCEHEVKMLDTMRQAGVNAPQVLTSSHNAILMEFLGDDVQGAPILHSLRLDRAEAESLLARIMNDVRAMLAKYVVHADLSPFNILYWKNDFSIIDFPQAVDALEHPQGYELFVRDVTRVADYFARQGVTVDATQLAKDVWREVIEEM